ncbi:MAG TPA: hypothetical protein ENI04_00875 [Candidatus Wildermuthbacteria bacterium]|nr:hypothetical protein [Candidatus Wildermuthbacteria bacterium]
MRNLFDITKDQILEDTTLSSLARPQDLPEDPPEWFKSMLNERRRQSVSEYETILEWKKRKAEIQIGKHQSPQVGLTPLAVSEEERNRARTVNKALVDFARIFPREGAGLVLQLKGEKDFKPVTKLERLVFGDEPVLPLSKQGEEFLQGVGFSEAKSISFGLPVGIAFLALDLLPVGGAKNVFRLLARTKNTKKIISTLRKIGVADDLLESTATRIAKTSDEGGIAKILDEVDKEQVKNVAMRETLVAEDALTKEARKFKTADEFVENDWVKQGLSPALEDLRLVNKPTEIGKVGDFIIDPKIRRDFIDVLGLPLVINPKLGFGFLDKITNVATRGQFLNGLLQKKRLEVSSILQPNEMREVLSHELVHAKRNFLKRPTGILPSTLAKTEQSAFDAGKFYAQNPPTKSQLTDFFNQAKKAGGLIRTVEKGAKAELGLSRETREAVEKLLKKDPNSPIAVNTEPRLFKRVAEGLRSGKVQADDISMAREYGLNNLELADLFETAASTSGKILNQLSQISREIIKIAPDLRVPPAPLTVWDRIKSAPKNVINMWRASLVSQLATAMRNFEVFGFRYFMNAIDDAAVGAFEIVTGRKAPRQAFAPLMEDMFAIPRALNPQQRARMADILASAPLLEGKLLQTPVMDVVMGNKVARILGVFNRTQEMIARKMTFDAVLMGELGRRGLNPRTIQATEIPLDAMKVAVDKALQFTFAKAPTGTTARNFVRLWNDIPILSALVYPFPRYLTNAIRNIYEFSPFGVFSFLNPRYMKMLQRGDKEALSIINKSLIGATMFAIAWNIRNSDQSGERWYEVKVAGKTIDVRPFGPMLPVYLFIAEAIRDPRGLELKDYAEGVLGINRMAGTTLFMTSMLAGQGPEELKEKIIQFSGEFIGGFGQPAMTFKDFLGTFMEEERTVRATRENPLAGPFMSKIPFLSQKLPAKPSITRAEPIQREAPGFRQLTGVSIKTKNFLESEIDRLKIPWFRITPHTGNERIDRFITELTGKLVSERLVGLESNPIYLVKTDVQKEQFLRARLADFRNISKKRILREHRNEIIETLIEEGGDLEGDDLERFLIKVENKGFTNKSISNEVKRILRGKQEFNPGQRPIPTGELNPFN